MIACRNAAVVELADTKDLKSGGASSNLERVNPLVSTLCGSGGECDLGEFFGVVLRFLPSGKFAPLWWNLADTKDLKSFGFWPYRFEPGQRHHFLVVDPRKIFRYMIQFFGEGLYMGSLLAFIALAYFFAPTISTSLIALAEPCLES